MELLAEGDVNLAIDEYDGDKIVTLKAKLRWTSDSVKIACWNRQVVHVAFSVNKCNQEVISWRASTGRVSGNMIRDLTNAQQRRR